VSYRERARRRFLARARGVGISRARAVELWSRATSASVWPDDVALTGTRLAVAPYGSSDFVDLTGSLRRMHFTETPAGTVNEQRNLVAARPWSDGALIEQRALRGGKRSLLDRLRGRS
jgi:hypothetical protein